MCLSLLGRQEEALAEVKRAQMLEPLSLRFNRNMGRVFYYMRRYDEAAAQYRKTLELDGNDSLTHEMLGNALEQKGDYDGAVAEWRTAMVLSKDEEQVALLDRAYKDSSFEKMIKAVLGKRLDRLTEKVKRGEFVPAAELARAYVRLGNREQALVWLERAFEERSRLVLEITVDPVFDTLRSDVRFQKLQDSLALKR
jgi:tetratricopeptide (TPR) repeat protein